MFNHSKPFILALVIVGLLASQSLAMEFLAGGGISKNGLTPELKARTWLTEKVGLDATLPLTVDPSLKVTPLIRVGENRIFVPYIGMGMKWKDEQLSSPELVAGLEIELPKIPSRKLVVEYKVNQQEKNITLAVLFDLASLYTKGKVDEDHGPVVDNKEDLLLLARLISAEARGEPFPGQIAVGGVVLNRVKSPLFPNTIRAVIYQPGQFSPVKNGSINREPTESSLRAAQEALAGNDPSQGALFFYNPQLCSPAGLKYLQTKKITIKIGNHVFAK